MKISKISKLGEKDPTYGQKYWCEVMDSLTPLMFNSQQEFQAGDDVTYESSEPKKSSKGTDYLLVKKVRKTGQTTLPQAPQDSPNEVLAELRKQTALLQKLAGDSPDEVIEPTQQELDGDVEY